MKTEQLHALHKDKGFSFIEIIVVIAVLVVLLAVLAPALLRYTESSRMQKDESAMDEVCNAIQLAMADSTTFDEVFSYSITNNYVTYTDSSGSYGQTIADEEFWAPDGNGHAVTITWNPDDNGTYNIAKGIVNDMTYGNGSVGQTRVSDSVKQCYLDEMGTQQKLYTSLKQNIGETLTEKSASYKNSSYTVFVRFNLVDNVYKPTIYGSFNGTNLSPDSEAAIGSGTEDYTPEGEANVTKPQGGTQQAQYNNSDLSGSGGGGDPLPTYKQDDLPCGHKPTTPGNHNELPCGHYACLCTCEPAPCGIVGHLTGDGMNHEKIECGHFGCECSGCIIPEGGQYITATGTVYGPGDNFPETVFVGDKYTYKSYEYVYQKIKNGNEWIVPGAADHKHTGWGVKCIALTNKDPEPMLKTICNEPITSLYRTYYRFSFTESPEIPETVTHMVCTYEGCRNLNVAPPMPKGLKHAAGIFQDCTSLTTAPDFSHCSQLIYLGSAFKGCSALTTFPGVSDSVTDWYYVFHGCSSLTGTITLNVVPYQYTSCFYGVNFEAQQLTLDGNCTVLDNMGKTGTNYCEICNGCHKKASEAHTCHGGSADNCLEQAICIVCNNGYGPVGPHNSPNGSCLRCGQSVIQFETAHTYPSSQNFVVLGTWDYSSAKSVDITIEYETESTSYDWISIVEGNDYIAGTSQNQAKNYLSVNGTITNTTGLNNSVRFGGRTRTTKTFTDVNMLTGTVVFRSDGGGNYWGAIVTITPNY